MNLVKSDCPVRGLLSIGVIALLFAATPGCQRGPAMAKVKGKVAFEDGSIPQGSVAVVRFEPADDSSAEVRKGATGAIESDGSFEMTTRMPGDGVYLGKYAVTFLALTGPREVNIVAPKFRNKGTTPFAEDITEDRTDLNYVIEKDGAAPAAAGGAAGK